MSKAGSLLTKFYLSDESFLLIDEDFTSSNDSHRAKNNKRARASRMGWKKYGNKYRVGIERNVRLNQLFVGRTSFLNQLKRRVKKVKTELRRRKMRELSKQKYLDRFKFNLFDSTK